MNCHLCGDKIISAFFPCWDCDEKVCENCINPNGLCDECDAVIDDGDDYDDPLPRSFGTDDSSEL